MVSNFHAQNLNSSQLQASSVGMWVNHEPFLQSTEHCGIMTRVSTVPLGFYTVDCSAIPNSFLCMYGRECRSLGDGTSIAHLVSLTYSDPDHFSHRSTLTTTCVQGPLLNFVGHHLTCHDGRWKDEAHVHHTTLPDCTQRILTKEAPDTSDALAGDRFTFIVPSYNHFQTQKLPWTWLELR